MSAPNPDIVAKLYNLDFGVFAKAGGLPPTREALKAMVRHRDGTPATDDEFAALLAAGEGELDALLELHKHAMAQADYKWERQRRIFDLSKKYRRDTDTDNCTMRVIIARMSPEDRAEWDQLWDDLGDVMVIGNTVIDNDT